MVFGSDVDPNGADVSVDEVRLFFASTTVREKANTNPLDWWKINAARFPSIAKVVRDVLVIQATSVASESAFSTAGRVVDDYRTRLDDNTIQSLMLLQSWRRYFDSLSRNK